jgi:hypothetical protein
MLDTFNELPEELDNECGFCGEFCDKDFCCKECEKAYKSEN